MGPGTRLVAPGAAPITHVARRAVRQCSSAVYIPKGFAMRECRVPRPASRTTRKVALRHDSHHARSNARIPQRRDAGKRGLGKNDPPLATRVPPRHQPRGYSDPRRHTAARARCRAPPAATVAPPRHVTDHRGPCSAARIPRPSRDTPRNRRPFSAPISYLAVGFQPACLQNRHDPGARNDPPTRFRRQSPPNPVRPELAQQLHTCLSRLYNHASLQSLGIAWGCCASTVARGFGGSRRPVRPLHVGAG
jgi:hypothetical protein